MMNLNWDSKINLSYGLHPAILNNEEDDNDDDENL